MNAEWWHPLVRCASCGAPPGVGPACAGCGRRFSRRGHILEWETPPRPATGVRGRWRAVFDPLRTPVLPFRYLTHARLERYYDRTLSDRSLAQAWALHYLRDLPLPPAPVSLDFGCGRGRQVALLTQLGHRVAGQDMAANPWWSQLPGAAFQTGADARTLPWAGASFDLLLETMVLHYLDERTAPAHIAEIARVLKPGGHAVLLEANDEGSGAAYVRRQVPRLHALSAVRAWARDAGLEEIDQWYEGYYAPRFPALVSYARKQLSPRPFDLSDYDSRHAARLEPRRRALWCLRLVRPA